MDNNFINTSLSTGNTYQYVTVPPETESNHKTKSEYSDTVTIDPQTNPETIFSVDLKTAAGILGQKPIKVTFKPESTFQIPIRSAEEEGMYANIPQFFNDGSFMVSQYSNLYTIDPANGNVKDTLTFPGKVLGLATDGDNLFISVGKKKGSLVAMGRQDKAEKWNFEDGKCRFEDVVMGPDKKTVYAVADNQKMYAIDAGTGKKKWDITLTGSANSGPTFSADGSTMYQADWSGRVYALDPETGTERWSFGTNSVISCTPAVDQQGNVLVNNWNGKLRSLDGKTGDVRWEKTLDGGSGRTPAIGKDGTVFLSTEKGLVYAFDPENGDKKWENATGMEFSSTYLGISVLPDGSLLLSGSSDLDSKLIVMDSKTGKVRYEYIDENFLALPPTFYQNGTMAISSTTGKTLVFRFQDPQEDLQKMTAKSGNVGADTTTPGSITYTDTFIDIDGALLPYRNPRKHTSTNNIGFIPNFTYFETRTKGENTISVRSTADQSNGFIINTNTREPGTDAKRDEKPAP